MLRIAVVDDQNEICAQVEKMLMELSKEENIQVDIEVYYNGKQLCRALQEIFYDLIFLDIEMRDFSGIDVSNQIRKNMKNEATQIAYISGHEKYAIEIFDFDPLYFLPKPLSKEKIQKVFLKLIRRLNLKADTFSYKVGHDTYKVPLKDIIYFESENYQTAIYYFLQGECKKDVFYGKLENIDMQLSNYRFFRIHKSYLVNLLHVKEYRYDQLQMVTGISLPIAQSKRKEIRNELLISDKTEWDGVS